MSAASGKAAPRDLAQIASQVCELARKRGAQGSTEQASRLALTSRAYSNDRLPLMLERLSALLGYDRALPVNTGLEAVETAIKAARKWAYKVKGVADGQAEIIVCANNFHGRSTTIVGFSSEDQYRDGFGPFTPGFRRIPFGDADALAAALTPHTAAGEDTNGVEPRGNEVVAQSGCLAEVVLTIWCEAFGSTEVESYSSIGQDGHALDHTLVVGSKMIPVLRELNEAAALRDST